MNEQTISERLEQLRAEKAAHLRAAELQQAAYEGAIQALEQVLTEKNEPAPDGAEPAGAA